ncbi:cell division protein FtsQ/DivIB [Deinococcus sedimenti]|uniref:Cell division protein FtsQ n=1 Tax=Deinococcus sedimenti TaxID=1867090 RepID=A0ABQ2S2V0_9DEIO|nr:FtsQ-type POTRA domain-containing protein [Deinococcus sedimenti]GGR80684.1 cell division protein FtsQ [Deinococcus sedimenti]
MTGPVRGDRPRNRRLESSADPLPAEAGSVVDLSFPGRPLPEPDPDSASEAVPPQRRRRSRRPLYGALAALLLVGAGVGAWFALPVRTVTVAGQSRLSEARVRALAGLDGEFGWLYYGRWRARGLLDSPWVQSAVVTRTFPDRVAIQVTERTPRARYQRRDGVVVTLARDGTVLPGATGTAQLPLIRGWGPDRVPEVLHLLDTLARYNVQSVMYTPSGVTVKLRSSSVWSGDLRALVKYAGSISMYPDSDIYIYPWGVSVQE